MVHDRKILASTFILREIRRGEADVEYPRIYIRSPRQKMEPDPQRPAIVLTEQGVGCRLTA